MLGKKSPAETLPEDRVSLKPLGGIRPGVYLGVLYLLGILLVLFLVLLYPGLSSPGSLAVLSSEPWGAAVRVDGLTMGVTPCEIFIPRGNRVIEITLPGFTTHRVEREIGARLWGSVFFPRREYIHGVLLERDPPGALILGAADYAAWSFAGEPTGSYQIPPSLSEGAYRSGPAAEDGEIYEEMNGILRGAARFAVTKAAARDLLRAKSFTDAGGLSPSPLTLTRSASDILAYLSETPGAAVWLAGLLDGAPALTGSAWYAKAAGAPGPVQPPVPPGRTLELGSLSFRELPGPAQEELSPTGNPPGFWISRTEVSLRAWEAFTEAGPDWERENLPALLEKGLVNEDYLAPYEHPSYPHPTVPGVSWYAAEAYCRWLTGLLPPTLASYEVRLPTEAEWEYAAKYSRELSEDMPGGMWEWCADFYAPLNFLPAAGEVIRAIGSPERSLRGGSWVNTRAVDIETRASLPPDSCSPFVSFRPVIAPAEGRSP
jgi:hypothetical protein